MQLKRVTTAVVLSLSVPAFAAAQAGSAAGAAGTGTGVGAASGTAAGGQSGGGPNGTTPGSSGGSGTTATGTTGTTTGTTAGTTASSSDATSGWFSNGVSHWVASGFVGSNFGASANSAAPDFGGSVGYLWRNAIGGEFVAGFTPNFQAQNLALFANERPDVNSYMANAIAAVPLGADANWQPFISGGFGAVTLRSGMGSNATTSTGVTGALDTAGNAISNTFAPDDTRPGGNIGAGLMGFVGGWGIRGDVRYFRAFNTSTSSNSTSTPTSAATTAAESVLPGLDFWRANIGVAFRW